MPNKDKSLADELRKFAEEYCEDGKHGCPKGSSDWKSMWEMYECDRNDFVIIADLLEDGERDRAAKKAAKLDTAARESIPGNIWNYLQRKDERTMRELAQEALEVQDACNLSGVVHGWGRSIMRLRKLLNQEKQVGTDILNTHPINQLWADKVGSLTGPIPFEQSGRLAAYAAVQDLARS